MKYWSKISFISVCKNCTFHVLWLDQKEIWNFKLSREETLQPKLIFTQSDTASENRNLFKLIPSLASWDFLCMCIILIQFDLSVYWRWWRWRWRWWQWWWWWWWRGCLQLCAVIIHAQFCHGQVCTAMEYAHKTLDADHASSKWSTFCWTLIIMMVFMDHEDEICSFKGRASQIKLFFHRSRWA